MSDLRIRALVVCRFDGSFDVDVSGAEVQRVVGQRIGWKPVLAVDLLAECRKFWEEVFAAFAFFLGSAMACRRFC